MINTFIVDDEKIARNGIKNFIDWEQYGFKIVGEAANALEALKKISALSVNLIITDIKMPFLSGVEFMKIIKERYPSIFLIIISGYGEFEFAKEAIALGASAYLLKPVRQDELLKSLFSIKESIEKQTPPPEISPDAGNNSVSNADPINNGLGALSDTEDDNHFPYELLSMMNASLDISAHMASNDLQALEEVFEIISNEIQEQNIPPDYVKSFVTTHIYMQAQKTIARYGYKLQDVFENPANNYAKISECKTADEMMLLLKKLVLEVAEFISASYGTKHGALIDKVRQYIGENYSNGNLSLESVAANIGITKNYLSSIFKKESGITFSDYVKKLRMEHAVALLKTKKFYIYEVADMVGYNNVTWFCTVFKKFTGISPTDYINQGG